MCPCYADWGRFPKSFVLVHSLHGQTRRASTFLVSRRNKGGFQLSGFSLLSGNNRACSSFLWRTDSLGKSSLKLIMTCGRRIKGTHVYRRARRRRGPAGLYICIFYLFIIDNSMLRLLWSVALLFQDQGVKVLWCFPFNTKYCGCHFLNKKTQQKTNYFILSLFLY